MQIATWNCNGALRNKLDALRSLDIDIAVVQECEDPARCPDTAYKAWAKNHLWIGNNKNKGLGVFAIPRIRLMPADLEPGHLESFLPFWVNDKFLFIAAWTRQANSPTFQYIGQFWKFIQLHRSSLAAQPSILIGDLNSNVRWDKWDRWWNHSDVVRELGDIGIVSVYHHSRKILQGAEPEPTFFLHRNPAKPYHIDYAFAPIRLLSDCSAYIGKPEEWLPYSDHMPLVINLPALDKTA